MTKTQWRWIGSDGFEYTGDVETLRASLAGGQLPQTTMVWSPGMDGWLPAHQVRELADPGFAAAPAPLQPHAAFVPEDDAPTIRENPIPEPPAVAEGAWAVQPAAPPPALQPAAWQPAPAPAKKSGGWILTALGAVGGAVILAMIGGLGAYAAAEAKKAPDPLASASTPSASAGVAQPEAPRACSAGPAKELEKAVVGRVGLDTLSLEAGKLAVGFASDKDSARALILDGKTLEVEHRKDHESRSPIVGVYLTHGADGVEVGGDVESKELSDPRTVVGTPEFILGTTAGGIARQVADHDPELVWPGGEGDATIPRVDTLTGLGHFVTLRRGGQHGKIVAGWLDMQGNKQTELSHPAIEADSVGTPSAAVGPAGALLLVAARADAKAPWQVFAGHAKAGAVPEKLAPLALGDPTTARISPTATPLGERWLLQWTEGGEDSHVVKVQLLSPELAPQGEAVTVSRSGSDSGQGAIWSDGEQVVSLFLVSTGDGHQLWAAPLECK